MKKLTNTTDIPLALAVWLAGDDYDYIDNKYYLSATSLLKPVKQIILAKQGFDSEEGDVSSLVPSALGSTIHAGIEKAWKENYKPALKSLGYTDDVINKIKINPKEPEEDDICIYLEQRSFRKMGKWTIGGKFDMVMDGLLHDNKTTSAFSWMYGTRDEEYVKQCSIYRWLNQDIITEDFFRINFIFTDWSKANTYSNENYPKNRIMYKDYKFMSLEETEDMIKDKLREIQANLDNPEDKLPRCDDEDLWRKPTVFKYYLSQEACDAGKKCNKSFTTFQAALHYQHTQKGGRGVIKTVPGEVRRCLYCKCFDICQQRKEYFPDDRSNYS